mmetsp:Transcript_20506/g.34212  ORF Transcript_20506/g.34212 Transcript_20506/m.34212 type:complete len:667 (+) Transcript_20506:148-2148(+)
MKVSQSLLCRIALVSILVTFCFADEYFEPVPETHLTLELAPIDESIASEVPIEELTVQSNDYVEVEVKDPDEQVVEAPSESVDDQQPEIAQEEPVIVEEETEVLQEEPVILEEQSSEILQEEPVIAEQELVTSEEDQPAEGAPPQEEQEQEAEQAEETSPQDDQPTTQEIQPGDDEIVQVEGNAIETHPSADPSDPAAVDHTIDEFVEASARHHHVHLGEFKSRVLRVVGGGSIGFVDNSGQPGTGTNFLATHNYHMKTVDLPAQRSSVSTLTVPLCASKTISFSPAVQVAQVPEDWGSWWPGYTGAVLMSLSAPAGRDEVLRIDFSRLDARAFDFYVKANDYVTATLSVTVNNTAGVTSTFSQSVAGNAESNPIYFGMYVTGTTANRITRITLRMGRTAEGFAIGQLRAACLGVASGACGATTGVQLGMNTIPTTCTIPSSRSEPFDCVRTVYRPIKRIFTATFAGSYTFSTLNTNFDTVLAIRNYTTCDELGCSDDFQWLTSWVRVRLNIGDKVVVALGSYRSYGCGVIPLSIMGYPAGGQCLPTPSGATQYLAVNRRTSAGDTCRGPWDPAYAVCATTFPIFGARAFFFVAPTAGRYNFTAELPNGGDPVISVRSQFPTSCRPLGCNLRSFAVALTAGQQVHVVAGGRSSDCGLLYVTARKVV